MSETLSDYLSNYDGKAIQDYCTEQLTASPVDLYKLIKKAREMTLAESSKKPKKYKGKNYMAEVMSGNMIGLANENYPELIGKDVEGCSYLSISKNLRVYFKKLDNNVPNNIMTDSAKDRRAELMLNDEKIYKLFAGYTLSDNDWAKDFKNIVASYMNKYYPLKKDWVIDLSDYQKSNAIIVSYEDNVEETPLVSIPDIGIGKAE